jgi:hypothetical protein
VTRRRAAALAVALTAALLSGCGSSNSSPSSSPSSHGRIFNLAKTRCPKKNPPSVGHCILITNTGFEPNTLVAPMGIDITWTNTSAKPVSVVFTNYYKPLDSGPIPPGGTWKFHAGELASIIYHAPQIPRSRSQLQIQAAETSGANQ